METWVKAAVQGAACGLVFGMVVLIGGRVWQPAVPEVVRARRFEVVDKDGNTRVRLGPGMKKDWDMPVDGLVLYDGTGKARAALWVFPNGSTELALYDGAERQRVSLAALSLAVPFGVEHTGSEANAQLKFLDSAGNPRAGLSLHSDGGPWLDFQDATGMIRASLNLMDDSSPSLRLWDKKGTSRAVLGTTSLRTVKTAEVRMRPESSVVLFDKDGTVIWQAP